MRSLCSFDCPGDQLREGVPVHLVNLLSQTYLKASQGQIFLADTGSEWLLHRVTEHSPYPLRSHDLVVLNSTRSQGLLSHDPEFERPVIVAEQDPTRAEESSYWEITFEGP